jgi:hypothetical protein
MGMNVRLKEIELETKRLEYASRDASGEASTATTTPQRASRQVVSQYTLDGRLVKQHSSYAAAAKAVNGNRNTLADKCRAHVAYKEYMWKCE